MSNNAPVPSARRLFLRRVGDVSGVTLALPALIGSAVASDATTQPSIGDKAMVSGPEGNAYLSLSPQEGSAIEALVDLMCPADALTGSGTSCGLHHYIDRQLAGGWGRGDQLYRHGPWSPGKPQQGYQSPLTPEQYVKAGLAAFARLVQLRTGQSIENLESTRLDALLQEVAEGKLDGDAGHALGAWFNDAFYPLFVQACFADPMYGGNRDKAHWRAIGYPGLPALHGRDVVQLRGRLHPGAATPKSIEDFS